MKKPSSIAGLFATAVLLCCGLNVFGQEKEPTATAPTTAPATAPDVKLNQVFQQRVPAPAGANTFSFVNSEFIFDGKPIKGSPYSAEAVTETTQLLSDGNRIVNSSTASLYRDSEGRTRREQTLKAIGGVAAGAQPLQTIMINDPVAGVTYSLDPVNRIARKGPMGMVTFQRAAAAPGTAGSGNATFVVSSSGSEAGTVRAATAAPTAGAAVTLPSTNAPSITWSTQSAGGSGYQIITRDGPSENVNKEDLGTLTIEGVSATGTRVTFTIPAGQIGNERAIDIVDERWFSKELQVFVMTRHSDPRSGETVYRLTNINRTEPDHSLFQVPADYDIKDGGSLPMRTRKPE